MPFFRRFGVTYYIVARPLISFDNPDNMTASIVVPCKNEEGNIEAIVDRIPEIGGGTEIIFVDDKSTDSTSKKIFEQIQKHPKKTIKMIEGLGTGKGAACRAGFAVAEHDVFMILDADMTVMPEVLPEFFEIITSGKGEFINGSRLLYPMEEQAMRIANVFGNKMFAMLFTFLLEQPIKDTLCGTKVILKRDYHKIIEARSYFDNIDLWGDFDWIFGASLHNLKIIELPIHYVSRKQGQTKMTGRLRNALIMLRMCWVAFLKLKLA
jgi:glycosyltransferase involved in cell wall biosynthesis